jgi:hypothetical protein
MEEAGDLIERLADAQARLRDTVREVKLCCVDGAPCSLIVRAADILIQRLNTYVAREGVALHGHACDGDAGPAVLLRDLQALRSAAYMLPAVSLGRHVVQLADEVLRRLERERRDACWMARVDGARDLGTVSAHEPQTGLLTVDSPA